MLLGQRIERLVVRRPDLRWPLPGDLGQRLTDATVTALRRRAKYGLMDTDRDDTLLFHLGMSGKFHCLDGPPGRHDHVLFEIKGRVLAFHDPRRFGSIHLVPTPEVAQHPLLANIGPEPFDEAFSPAYLAARAQGRQVTMKALLLDQQVVAGIGNIYASEALHMARIDPRCAAGAISPDRFGPMVQAVRKVLDAAILAGGSTLRDHAQPSGDSGYFQHEFEVYGREGQACHSCGKPVQRMIQSGRSTFWCPACQQ